jgi:hypothetical protein
MDVKKIFGSLPKKYSSPALSIKGSKIQGFEGSRELYKCFRNVRDLRRVMGKLIQKMPKYPHFRWMDSRERLW